MTATTVDEYLEKLPADRRAVLSVLRDTINANLPDGCEEGIVYNMPGWYVPLARYPDTYNGQPIGIAGLASQKNYMSLYLMSVYSDPALETWFKIAYRRAGKKLDMGKSCVRFKKLEDLALDVIAQTIAKISVENVVARYEAVKKADSRPGSARAVRTASQGAKPKSGKKPAATKPAAKKPAGNKSAAAKPAGKKSPAKKPAGKKSARKPKR